jgi:hypothetical protein
MSDWRWLYIGYVKRVNVPTSARVSRPVSYMVEAQGRPQGLCLEHEESAEKSILEHLRSVPGSRQRLEDPRTVRQIYPALCVQWLARLDSYRVLSMRSIPCLTWRSRGAGIDHILGEWSRHRFNSLSHYARLVSTRLFLSGGPECRGLDIENSSVDLCPYSIPGALSSRMESVDSEAMFCFYLKCSSFGGNTSCRTTGVFQTLVSLQMDILLPVG